MVSWGGSLFPRTGGEEWPAGIGPYSALTEFRVPWGLDRKRRATADKSATLRECCQDKSSIYQDHRSVAAQPR